MTARGFTLIELLAATALSAILMTVGFGVLRSIGRPVASGAGEAWTVPLASTLRADLAHAVAVRVDGDAITFAGLNAIDPTTFAPSHRPATVAYRVATIGGLRWLVREQTSLDRTSPASVDLVCANVTSLRLALPPLEASRGKKAARPGAWLAGDASLPQMFRQLPGYRPAPDRWLLSVEFEGRPPLVISEAR